MKKVKLSIIPKNSPAIIEFAELEFSGKSVIVLQKNRKLTVCLDAFTVETDEYKLFLSPNRPSHLTVFEIEGGVFPICDVVCSVSGLDAFFAQTLDVLAVSATYRMADEPHELTIKIEKI